MSKFALEVEGQAMEPVLFEGDKVIVDPEVQPRGNAKDIALFEINGEHYVSRFFRYGNQIVLLFDNASGFTVRAYEATILGKVMYCDPISNIKEKSHCATNTMTSYTDQPYLLHVGQL